MSITFHFHFIQCICRGLLSEMRYSFSRNARGDIVPPIFMPRVSGLRAGVEPGDDDDGGDGDVMHSEADERRDAGSERFMALLLSLLSSPLPSSPSPSSLVTCESVRFFFERSFAGPDSSSWIESHVKVKRRCASPARRGRSFPASLV